MGGLAGVLRGVTVSRWFLERDRPSRVFVVSDKAGLKGLNEEEHEGAKSLDREGEWRRRDKGESLPPDSVVTGTTASSSGGQTLYKRDGEDGTKNYEDHCTKFPEPKMCLKTHLSSWIWRTSGALPPSKCKACWERSCGGE